VLNVDTAKIPILLSASIPDNFERMPMSEKSKIPKKPGNTPLSGLYLSFLDIKTTVSTSPETVEKIIILVHAVWELVKVGTCCSGICQKYDAPLPSMISATLQNTLNWNLVIYSQSFFIIQYASI
jgi:hypothetical protein